MKTVTHTCDVGACGNSKDVREIVMTVIFLTDQTEGRSCSPYLAGEKFDICPKCLERVLDGNMIYGSGAQGANTYFFKKV